MGVDGDDAVTWASSGGAVTESRWLIHTTCSSGVSSNSAPPAERRSARPNSEPPVRSTLPPRSSAISCMP